MPVLLPAKGPAFWNLVSDEVLPLNMPQEVHLQAFSDDFVFLVKAVTKQEVQNLVNKASEDKTNYLQINKKRERPIWNYGIKWGQSNIKRTSVIKYLGVLIDDKLNFAAHLSTIKNKSLILYQGLKKVAGTSWGLSKNIRTVVEKFILYALAAWAHNITVRQQKLLSSYQRNFLLIKTLHYQYRFIYPHIIFLVMYNVTCNLKLSY
ncbi:hypothetical protein AVEN_83469-1 [Araneus ventricosus]|uniref:Reverse transcriptase domain-containing protein n=1 Tax=Araneus ventricosus TaxID=182803 RepID=A0A4Y2JQC4_ARAVE|nr:hypothetical protein AVEN_83469-1 [Araneus ventricosus]